MACRPIDSTSGTVVEETSVSNASLLSCRFEPGTDFCPALAEVLTDRGVEGAAILTAVGALSSATYCGVTYDADGVACYGETVAVDGPLELISLVGHFGRSDDGVVRRHLHAGLALHDGRAVGGHLFAATVLTTLEVTLLVGAPWHASLFTPSAAAPELTYLLVPGGWVSGS